MDEEGIHKDLPAMLFILFHLSQDGKGILPPETTDTVLI